MLANALRGKKQTLSDLISNSQVANLFQNCLKLLKNFKSGSRFVQNWAKIVKIVKTDHFCQTTARKCPNEVKNKKLFDLISNSKMVEKLVQNDLKSLKSFKIVRM